MSRRLNPILLCLISVALPAHADTFHLPDGEVRHGTILRSIGNTFSIQLDENAGMIQLPVDSITHVEIATVDGGAISGDLLEWEAGIYLVSSPDRGIVTIQDGVVSEFTSDSEAFGIGGPEEPAQAPSTEHQGTGPVM